jgi:hypothetical protein
MPSRRYNPMNPNKVNSVFPEETVGDAPEAVLIINQPGLSA